MIHYEIKVPGTGLENKIAEKIDNLNKPKGSLGRLETLAMQICKIQETLSPELKHPCHILFGADHGIANEGVSLSPIEVTWQQMENFARGGAGINMFCRQHGFKLYIVDTGVAYDFSGNEKIIDRKIAWGTENFLHSPAMSMLELEKAFSIGREMTDKCKEEGCNIISFGEMGIGNTSPSSIWMHMFESIPLEKCVGAGSGLSSEGIRRKFDILKRAEQNFFETTGIEQPAPFEDNSRCCSKKTIKKYTSDDVLEIIRWFGGFEMTATIGGMLRAAERGMVIIVDGFIMTACMLAASQLYPEVMNYAVFGHCGDETGHKQMLENMGASPLLNLGLRLGEGTGAVCAYPIIESAVRMMNEMDNFEHAEITKYF